MNLKINLTSKLLIIALVLLSCQAYAASVSLMARDSELQQDAIDLANKTQSSRTLFHVHGRNTNVNNTRCDVWEGPTCSYVFPAAPQTLTIISSSASDSATGTGARSVMIHYLDGSFVEHEETLVTNGTTSVNTVANDIYRVNGFHLASAGSSGTAVGDITLKSTNGAVTYSKITASFNTSRQLVYTVPDGHYGYISHWQTASGAINGSHFTVVTLRSTMHEGTLFPATFLLIDEVGLLNNSIEAALPIPVRLPPHTDMKMGALSDASNAGAVVTGSVFGWLEHTQ